MFNETAHLSLCGVVRERLLPYRIVVTAKSGLYRVHGLRVSSLCPVAR